MKKNFLVILACLWATVAFPQSSPQTVHRCLSEEVLEHISGDRQEHIHQFEEWMALRIAQNRQGRRTRIHSRETSYILPVVVHIIHNGEAIGEGANVPTAQVMSQLEVINRDFRRFNADSVDTPDLFKPVAADTGIEFVLSPFDTTGNLMQEPGIHRIAVESSNWNFANTLTNLIPEHIWDPSRYLNFFVIDFASGQDLGFGIYPVSNLPGLQPGQIDVIANNQMDGIVMDYRNFGVNPADTTLFDLRRFFDLGRTTTHEIGHYLGLRHIWGDGGCDATDFVEDTPPAAGRLGNDGYGRNGSCTFPGPDSCPNDEFPDMFQNYMDYTTDLCMNLFTLGQTERMHVVLENAPNRRSLHELAPPPPLAPNLELLSENIVSLSWEVDHDLSEAFVVQKRGHGDGLFQTIGYTLPQNQFFVDTLPFLHGAKSYAYRVLAANTMGISLPSPSVQSVIASLDEPLAQADVSLFPNPTAGYFEVRLGQATKTPAPWRLYTSTGQLVRQGKIPEQQTQMQLNLSEQTDGFFIFEILVDGRPSRKKIIKKG